jgi:alkylation response protein AidB-like acyl-CoA dehydrogenase
MDLNYSEKHQQLRSEIKDFIAAEGHKSPKFSGGRQRPDAQVLAWQKLLLERGYFGRTIPREYGGFGADPDVLDTAIIADELSRAGMFPGIMSQGISMLIPTLLEVGTEEQRQRWIKPTLYGEIIWCQGYSEPGSGSDLANAQTRAEIDGDDFVINGQKIWTSSAHFSDMMFLLCRTEPDETKHRGLSYLLLPMDTPGIEVRPLVSMTERAEFNETFFTDVRVPTDQIVMGRGDGWKVANVTLKHERMLLGDANKHLQRFHRIEKLLKETEIDGTPLIEMAEYRDRLARIQGEVLASKFHHMRLLSEQHRGEDSGVKRMIVKYFGTVLAHKLTALAIDALGEAGLPYDPLGVVSEDDEATAWQVDYMFDIGLIIGGGTSQIQKNIISERGLGMPREPKVQVPAGRA